MPRQAIRDRFATFLLLCSAAVMGVAILSGRHVATVSAPVFANGFQLHAKVIYGTLRVHWGEQGTHWSGLPAGFSAETLDRWRWEWNMHVAPTRQLGTVQLPLWFPALLLVAWFVARRARIALRLAAGVCPFCGKASGGTDRCPRCKRLLPHRQSSG